jgi:Protein of unknown function (DUF1351)
MARKGTTGSTAAEDALDEVDVVGASHELVIYSEQPGGAIEANFDALKEQIDGILADYADLVVTPDYLKQAKKDRAYLNSLSTSINQRRKDVKLRYMAPVVAFEARVAQLDAPIREASAAIDVQVKKFEETERALKRSHLRKHYTDFAGALAGAVPFERIEEAEWLNKSCDLVKAYRTIEDIVERIVKDEATLTELGLRHPLEAKAEYIATLDLSRAIARSKEIDAQLERVRVLEEEKAETARWQAEQAAKKAAVVAPVVEAPELLCARCLTAPVSTEGDLCRNCVADVAFPLEPTPVAAPEAREWTFSVTCTREQLDYIIAAVKAMGLQGRVRG